MNGGPRSSPEPSVAVRPGPQPEASEQLGERRAPVVVTLLVAMILPPLVPTHFLPLPGWLFSAVLGGLLVLMLALDPGRIDKRSAAARRARLAVVAVLVASTGWATVVLTHDLIWGRGSITDSGPSLFKSGGLVWIGLVISFAFLYWELDLGGPAERAHSERRYPDLAFPGDLSPEIHRPGWRPVFTDYLYLGLTNGLAFSPTDVMPIAQWAKLAMAVQSVASLALLGLVIARAVNIFK